MTEEGKLPKNVPTGSINQSLTYTSTTSMPKNLDISLTTISNSSSYIEQLAKAYNNNIVQRDSILEARASVLKTAANFILLIVVIIGVLLAIPAIVQTSTTFAWARQKRNRPFKTSGQEKLPINDNDRYLFMYRLLACISSLATLLLSSFPRVLMDFHTFKRYEDNTAFIAVQQGLDLSVRTFSTYMIIAPYIILFYNFYVSQVMKKPNIGIIRIFPLITAVAIPIFFFSTSLMIWRLVSYESLILTYYKYRLIDLVVNMTLPLTCIIIMTLIFLRYIKKGQFGILFEPVFFASFILPEMLIILLGIVLSAVKNHGYMVQSLAFSIAHKIAHCFYHCSFSCTFLMAAFRSIISQIKAEKARRKRLYSVDVEDDLQSESSETGVQRKHFIASLIDQYSIAYRFKSLDCEDDAPLSMDYNSDKKIVYTIPAMVLPEGDGGDNGIQHGDMQISNEKNTNTLSINNKPNKRRRTLEDVMLHYNVLKTSTFLKTPSSNKSQPQRFLQQAKDSSSNQASKTSSNVTTKPLIKTNNTIYKK